MSSKRRAVILPGRFISIAKTAPSAQCGSIGLHRCVALCHCVACTCCACYHSPAVCSTCTTTRSRSGSRRNRCCSVLTRTALRLHDCVRAARTGLLRTYRTYLRHTAAGVSLSVRRTLTSLARAVLCATGPARPPLRTLLDDARRVVQRRQRRAVRRPCSLAERPLHPRLRGGCRRAGGRDPARTDQRQPGAAGHPAVPSSGLR